jgi:hypothetical protein
MKHVVKYELTVILETDGTLIEPSDAVDIKIESLGDGVEITDYKAERTEG